MIRDTCGGFSAFAGINIVITVMGGIVQHLDAVRRMKTERVWRAQTVRKQIACFGKAALGFMLRRSA
jgi:hypothetical protein